MQTKKRQRHLLLHTAIIQAQQVRMPKITVHEEGFDTGKPVLFGACSIYCLFILEYIYDNIDIKSL
jgi:hypothetical protein